MDDVSTTPQEEIKTKISAAEMERRRKIVRQADANNRIEGIFRDRESDEVFDAYIRGDIEVDDIGLWLKAQPGP